MTEQLPDQIEKLPGGSIIQHGPYNDRIYLMKLGDRVPASLPVDLIALARRHKYSKVFLKIPSTYAAPFARAGYAEEAAVPALYKGSEPGIFMGFYLNKLRAEESNAAALDEILQLALDKCESLVTPLDGDRFLLRRCAEGDVEAMAAIYGAIFPTYPFPIHDPSFLLQSMKSHVDYFGVERQGALIALSAAEIDRSAQNAEMTDFATLAEWRGNGLGVQLLLRMEKEMQQKGIRTAYTIARANSAGMNITFAKLGYSYGGRLKNNTNISGNIESMNIWYKTC